MFEFAISRNQIRRPSKLIILTGVASCLIHFLVIIVLVKNPELLRGTVIQHIRSIHIFYRTPQKQMENNRIVTILRPIEIPSAALLKKYMAALKKGDSPPPVRIRLNDNLKIASANKLPPAPKLPESKQKSDIALPANATPSSPLPSIAGLPDSESKQPGAAQNTPGKIPLPPTGTSPAKQEAAGNKTPDTAKLPAIETTSKQNSLGNVKIFENEKQAIRNKTENAVFDAPQGYSREKLDKYVSNIIGQIKENWFIPSNLKNSQGRATVVFFIDKNGGLYDTRLIFESGNPKLDLTVLRAIYESDPVDPLPTDYPGDHLGAKFIFSYNEP